jgi:hypothetical protein
MFAAAILFCLGLGLFIAVASIAWPERR